MLVQLIHWAEMAGTILEGLLLVRMLSLKLQRLYTFLTLFWAVNLIFDASVWALGWETQKADTLQMYSLFVLGILFPLTVWDVFEEMKPTITKFRMTQGTRMLSGLFATLFIAAVLFAFAGSSDADKDPGILGLAPIVWFGSACASILFLWTLRLVIKKQSLALPHNTALWLSVFLTLLGCNIVNAFGLVLAAFAPLEAFQWLLLVIDAVALAAMTWGLVRMRAVPSETSPEPQRAPL